MQKILREPLVHFLLIGGGLFFLYSFLNPKEEQLDNNIIQLEDSDIQRLVKAYQQNWNERPDKATLQNLIDEEIKAEVFYREALDMQLDHNDEIIRRRLKQKYEFLVKDLADSQQATEAELKDFYEKNPTLYKAPATLSFTQIYFSPDKRKEPLHAAQKELTSLLKKGSDQKNLKNRGDDFHLQQYFADRDYNDVRQLFGQDFAKGLFQINQTGWAVPIKSGYGIHLVNVTTIQNEAIKPFQEVKAKILTDWKVGQQQQYNKLLYENLLQKYEVKYDLEKWAE